MNDIRPATITKETGTRIAGVLSPVLTPFKPDLSPDSGRWIRHCKWLITNGVVRRGMPAWSKLPEPQRWQIIVFLRSRETQKARGFNFRGPSVTP